MLFHPRKPIKTLWFTFHGVFPRRKADIARRMGNVVAKEILSGGAIAAELSDEQSRSHIASLAGERIEARLRKRGTDGPLLVRTLLNDGVIIRVREMAEREVSKAIPDWVSALSESESLQARVQNMVEKKVLGFSEAELEALLFSLVRKELSTIEIWGAVLGFIIGCIQLCLLLLFSN